MLCNVTYDKKAQVLEIRSHAWGATIAKIKLEKSAAGTMARIDMNGEGEEDCDNYWLGVKPADSVVFGGEFASNKGLVVQKLNLHS